MASDVSMCSNALLLIGDEAISSFSDTGHGATVADALYPDVYRQVLSEHPWSFAFKEQDLSRLAQAPDSSTGYSYQFQLPADCIRVWATFPHGDYVIVGDKLYSNQPDLFCRYVYEVAESQLPPFVIKAIEYKLASEFAVPVTEDTVKANFYEQKYVFQLAKAKNIDAQSRPATPIIDSPFLRVR